jgi:SAM-dependent methyltransferase
MSIFKESNWKDYKINGRDFKDLIHPSGTDDKKYFNSGLLDANKIKQHCNFKNNSNILEYGCGNGRILKHLQNYNIHGVDLVQDFLDDGIKNGIKNLYNIKDELSKSFDIIYCYTVFIHLSNEDTIKALKYIHDKLKINGKAYLQIPLYEKQTNHDGNFICVRSWETKNIFPILKNIGFKILDFKVSPNKFNYSNIGKHHDDFILLTKI